MGKIMIEKLELFLDKICDCSSIDIIRVINYSHLRLLTVNYQKNIDRNYYYISMVSKRVQSGIYEVQYEAIQEFLHICEQSGLKPVFMKGIFLAVELFKGLGYECDGSESLEKRYEQVQSRHIRYQKKVGEIVVLIEVHSSILNPPNLFRIDVRQFLINIRQIEYRGLKPYVLAIEYNLIALILHFFKHLPADYFQKAMVGKKCISIF